MSVNKLIFNLNLNFNLENDCKIMKRARATKLHTHTHTHTHTLFIKREIKAVTRPIAGVVLACSAIGLRSVVGLLQCAVRFVSSAVLLHRRVMSLSVADSPSLCTNIYKLDAPFLLKNF